MNDHCMICSLSIKLHKGHTSHLNLSHKSKIKNKSETITCTIIMRHEMIVKFQYVNIQCSIYSDSIVIS